MNRQNHAAPGAEPERGFLLAVLAPRSEEAAEIAELGELARAAGVEPVGTIVQHRAGPDRRTYVGRESSRSSSTRTARRTLSRFSWTTS